MAARVAGLLCLLLGCLARPTAGSRHGLHLPAEHAERQLAAQHRALNPGPLLAGDQLGIHHFVMQGNMQAGNGQGMPERVILHIWLKGLVDDEGLHIRGFAFAESANEDISGWSQAECAQKPLVKDWHPQMYFESVASGEEHSVSLCTDPLVVEPTNRGYDVITAPMPLEARIPHPDSEGELTLRIAGWDRYIVYMPQMHALPRPQPPAGPPRVYSLLPPVWDINTTTATALLKRSLEYHTKLGFAGAVVYVSPLHFAAYAHDQQLQPFIESHQLMLVLWDDVPEVANRPRCYKPMAFSHGLLSQWGQNALMFIADIDEYYAIPSAQLTLADTIAEFTNDTALAMVTLKRWNVVCDECNGGDETQSELAFWQQHPGPDHPVGHYTKRAKLPLLMVVGKMLVHADRAIGFAVHDGTPLCGFHKGEMPTDLAFAAHMYNLFIPRRQSLCEDCEEHAYMKPLEFETFTSWLWSVGERGSKSTRARQGGAGAHALPGADLPRVRS